MMYQNGTMPAGNERVAWVDYAKGFCIIMVVMMHSVLGVEAAAGQTGFMHVVVEFAKPFRMPDFFMISGLFVSRVIDRDWRLYLDRKVVHFVYFYLLWTAIQFATKAPMVYGEVGGAGLVKAYLMTFIEPYNSMWFIYLLPVFLVAVRLVKRVHPAIIWLIMAALEIAHIETGWTLIDEFAARGVYFYTGFILSPYIFTLAARAQARPARAVGVLLAWAFVDAFFVYQGWSDLPFVSLGLGLIGAAAVVRFAALLSLMDVCRPLRYCGRNSIVVYLTFFLPMATTRIFLLKTGIVPDIGVMSVIVTTAGFILPLCLFWAVQNTRFAFLYERPKRFWLTEPARPAMQPAE
jgi:uncharacterized membrane protein YcfT